MGRYKYRYGFIDPLIEINKIRRLIHIVPNLKFTKRSCPFNFNLALDRNLIEPSGKYISVQLSDGGITETEYKFKLIS